jgi:D-serine deaminase-like pyridoxal phosphate-dependent protein
MNLADLTTPCALVERARVERNTTRMRERAAALGVQLRPHVKTHKTQQGARLQLGASSGPIAVSTLAEAHQFAEWGFDDITYAVPIALGRLPELLELHERGCQLAVLLDSPVVLKALRDFATGHGLVVPVYLKLDCGYHRAGVQPHDPAGLALCRAMVESPAIDFRGVLAHAGHSYASCSAEEIRRIAEEERRVTVTYVESLRAAGVPVRSVSVGSTPTIALGQNLEGVTEVRPGNYVFYDCFQAAIGSCRLEDIALSVLTTIIGSYPDRQTILIDAGALALSKDAGPTHLGERPSPFGRVCSPDACAPLPGLRLISLSQEHGHVVVDPGVSWEALQVGRKLRVLPNHSCLTSALHPRYWLVEGSQVTEAWTPVRGW